MKFIAIPPTGCTRCRESLAIPLAFAVAEDGSGYVMRLVCPVCHGVWDNSAAGENTIIEEADHLSLEQDRTARDMPPPWPFSNYPEFKAYLQS